MSILGLLGVAFVVLKLCHVIAWSWWLVLLPFYGGVALVVAAYLGLGSLMGVVTLADKALRTVSRSKPKRPTMRFR